MPQDPRLAFLSSLLEDYGDEWVTKAMFHYRWTYDIEDAGFGIGTGTGFGAGIETVNKFGATFGARQVSRKGIVGSNEQTGPHIEESFERLCGLLGDHFEAGYEYLFGGRPSAADFSIYGQLHPMIALDPATSQKVLAASRTTWFWYHSMKDLSGRSIADENAGWLDMDQPLPPTLAAIFQEAGRMYAPFMVANAAAVAAGEKVLDCQLDAGEVHWVQPSFGYQAKCLVRPHAIYTTTSSHGDLSDSERLLVFDMFRVGSVMSLALWVRMTVHGWMVY